MPQGIEFTVNGKNFKVLSEYRGVESPLWDRGNHPAFDIYMSVDNSEFAKFDYYGSIQDFNDGKDELDRWEHCSVAQMIMSDAATGYEDFEDFCGNTGAEDNKESRSIYRSCVESYDKFDQVLHLRGDDLINTYNAMIDFENEESTYGTLKKEEIEIDDIKEGKFEVSRVENFDWSKVNFYEGDNENLTEQAVRSKYEGMKEPFQTKREVLSELKSVIDDIGEYHVEAEIEDWGNREELSFDELLVSGMYQERADGYKTKFDEVYFTFFEEFKNSVGATEPSEKLQVAFEALQNHIEKGISNIESSVGVNFEENEFEKFLNEVVEGYFPMMNSAWRTDNCPSDAVVKDILENAPNVSIVNVGNETYIAMNGAGFDMSNSIAYAYLKIDNDIPKELGVCRTQCLSGSEEAFQKVNEFLAKREIKEMAKNTPSGGDVKEALKGLGELDKNSDLNIK